MDWIYIPCPTNDLTPGTHRLQSAGRLNVPVARHEKACLCNAIVEPEKLVLTASLA